VRGLGDAISTDISLNDAIGRAPNQDNLFVLTAGQIPPDPIELLSSKKMHYLMEQFQAFFDLVIYDTPPLGGLADTHLIAAHTDATIMVVQIGKTDRSQVRKVLEELKISGASVLGIVAKGCQNSGHSYRPRPVVLKTLYDEKLSALGTKNPN
jgi:capsular exopolysaccharide synthesis family protein